ncbi:MAG: SBBP repeat-containing protein [Nitrospirae bacterium]|nr:SBBP repeat-containing protein [Nitrospirota bacterium]
MSRVMVLYKQRFLLMLIGIAAPWIWSAVPAFAMPGSHVMPESKDRPLQNSKKVKKVQLDESYGKLPLSFIQNNGTVQPEVAFFEKGKGHSTYFTQEGIYFNLANGSQIVTQNRMAEDRVDGSNDGNQVTFLKLVPLQANKKFQIVAEGEQEGKVNYFIGNDPEKWKRNLSSYQKIVYREIYPGIDIKFYGNNSEMEYDIIVKPGGDLSKIKLAYEGIKNLVLTKNGDLEIELNDGKILQKKPLVYQEIDGKRIELGGKFKILRESGKFAYSFEVGNFDKKQPLTIDPVLNYSSYLGGNIDDMGLAIALDAGGNIYVTGATTSTVFPLAGHPFQFRLGGIGVHQDAFVAKFNSTGTALVYSSYLGGSADDYGASISVDSAGNAYVTGITSSTDFPMASPVQGTYGGGYSDAFIAKINSTGYSLIYSTYLGGNDDDDATGIAIDSSGNAYVTGETRSLNFPTVNPFQAQYGGGILDAFVTKINAAGTALDYSTYLGGSDYDDAHSIAIDASGNAFVSGETKSVNFPITSRHIQDQIGGNFDAFLTELDAAGSAEIYSTFLGGSDYDIGWHIVLDGAHNIYMTGSTRSTNFPLAGTSFQGTFGGGTDVFVAKIHPFDSSGSDLIYSTYLGGSGEDNGYGIGVDDAGNAYVTGGTSSSNFPIAGLPIQHTLTGEAVFVAKLNADASALGYATFLGGSYQDFGSSIAVDSAGNAYLTGGTSATNFSLTNPVQGTYGGGYQDAFVAKLSYFPVISTTDASNNTTSPNVFETTLTAEQVQNGQTVYGYNNSVPGPTIRVKKGDHVIVHFQNRLPAVPYSWMPDVYNDTTIHWHGIEGNNASDGTHVTQSPVMPGDDFLYDFFVPRAGTFFYHPHSTLAFDQMAAGLAGVLVVDDYAGAGQITPLQSLIDSGVLPATEKVVPLTDVTVSAAKNEAKGEIVKLNSGDGIRLQLINETTQAYYRFDFPGTIYRIGGEGGLLNSVRIEGGSVANTDPSGGTIDLGYPQGSIVLAPGQRAHVVIIPVGSTGQIQSLMLTRLLRPTPDLNPAIMPTEAIDPSFPLLNFQFTSNSRLIPLALSEGQVMLSEANAVAPLGTDNRQFIGSARSTFTYSANGEPGINDFSWLHTLPHPPSAKYANLNDVILWEVYNDTDDDHPFHLHGFSMQPLYFTAAGKRWNYGGTEFVDVVSVPPHVSLFFKVAIKDLVKETLDALDPSTTHFGDPTGRWLFHCHIQSHAAGGMVSELVISNGRTKFGLGVLVNPYPFFSLLYDNVIQAGNTVVNPLPPKSGLPPLPSGFDSTRSAYFNIATDAVFSGNVSICNTYDPSFFPAGSQIVLLHNSGNGVWSNITTSLDTANHQVCGVTSSLSPFVITRLITTPPPSIQANVSQLANASGWIRSNTVVTFTCSDTGQGIASCPGPVTVSNEGAGQLISGTAVDNVGNSASTSVTINLDKTPPVINTAYTIVPDPKKGDKGTVKVTFTCSDPLSGVSTCPNPIVIAAEGSGLSQVFNALATDKAGNTSKAGCQILNQFISTVQAASGKTLTPNQANLLILAAKSLKTLLKCP